MSKKEKLTWTYNGNKYKVGESINSYPWGKKNIYPIVFYKSKLYKVITIKKAKSNPEKNKVCLADLYNSSKIYWTTVNKVFNIIRL